MFFGKKFQILGAPVLKALSQAEVFLGWNWRTVTENEDNDCGHWFYFIKSAGHLSEKAESSTDIFILPKVSFLFCLSSLKGSARNPRKPNDITGYTTFIRGK